MILPPLVFPGQSVSHFRPSLMFPDMLASATLSVNLVWDNFLTLSKVVFDMIVTAWNRHAQLHVELKTRPMFCAISMSLSIDKSNRLPLMWSTVAVAFIIKHVRSVINSVMK